MNYFFASVNWDWKHSALKMQTETNVLNRTFLSFVDSALKTETKTFGSGNINGNGCSWT
ncbi:hypothetical protein C1645_835540 [Glomus cerebriforme]|uniref:Uncharacterized protein n=1 Tax=Glomus cerebriforme TaxID=658196 RepID=A0A397SIJ8_9GLOM|nr:hypothetical protein C1645_835540 [Glomus cerebriforme]